MTITSYPVNTVGGQIRNILAGFADNQILMQRKDIEANPGVTPDTISYIENSGLTDIIVPEAVYNYLAVGDTIYVYDHIYYQKSVVITGKRTVSGDYFLETGETYYSGMSLADDYSFDIMYINYYQDYYVEARIMQKFVGYSGEASKELFRITDAGSPKGEISLNISLANDLNSQIEAITEGLQDDAQIKIYVEYREVYTGQTSDSWQSITGEDIIEGYAISQPELDKVLTLMENPEIYDGYKNIVALWHSDANLSGGAYIQIGIDYLDINQNVQSQSTGESFAATDFGLMYQDISTVPANCEYIRFNVNKKTGPVSETLNSTIYNTVTARSSVSLAYEKYEFLLRWYNRYGVIEQYLFEDWGNYKSVTSEEINITKEDKFDSIITSKEEVVTLIAEDIERGMLEAFSDLLESKNIIRIFRCDSEIYEADGYERLAVLSGSIKWQQGKQRFNVEIKVRLINKPLYL